MPGSSRAIPSRPGLDEEGVHVVLWLSRSLYAPLSGKRGRASLHVVQVWYDPMLNDLEDVAICLRLHVTLECQHGILRPAQADAVPRIPGRAAYLYRESILGRTRSLPDQHALLSSQRSTHLPTSRMTNEVPKVRSSTPDLVRMCILVRSAVTRRGSEHHLSW